MSPESWIAAGVGFAAGVVAAFAISTLIVLILIRYRWMPHAMAEERTWTGNTHS